MTKERMAMGGKPVIEPVVEIWRLVKAVPYGAGPDEVLRVMPTLFSRKYMRGKPKRTERLVGAFILGLLAFIVATFLLTGGLLANLVNRSPALKAAKDFFGISERPLFTAAPENMKPPPAPHELRVAEAMLPVLPEPWKRLEVKVSKESPIRLPAGLEGAHVYTTQYADGTDAYVVNIADMGSPEAAFNAWKGITPPNPQPLNVGRAGWVDPNTNAATFWSGRYVTQVAAQGPSKQDRLETLTRAVAAVQLNYGGPFITESAPSAEGPKPTEPQAPSNRAQFAEIPGSGLEAPTKIERFTDNLYEKIDGREGQFRAYGFVELRVGTYRDITHQQAYDVYLYDMGRPNNALGIYTSEKSEGAEALGVGHEGYLSGASAYFYKGKYYVNVLGPADEDQAATEIARRIAAAIAATISDAGGTLWADALLPKEGREGSLEYKTTSALAHDFLERFFFGQYKIGGTELKMFIHKEPGPDEAKALFAKYAEETPKYDNVVSREATDGGETLVSEAAGYFTVAFHKGPYFAGVTECKDRDLALKQAAGLRDKLNANDKGEPAPPKPAPGSESSEGGGGHGE